MSDARRPRIGRLVAVLVACALLGVGISRAGALLIASRPIADPQAIVVLASHEWERLPEAARAARGNHAFVLLTEPVKLNKYNCFECPKRTEWLVNLGVPADRVKILARHGTNTVDEAIATREYMAAQHYGRLLVVTSPYHTRRALATFREVFRGLPVDIGVEPARDAPARPLTWWWHGYDRRYVGYEWAGIAWYAIRHGVPVT